MRTPPSPHIQQIAERVRRLTRDEIRERVRVIPLDKNTARRIIETIEGDSI